MSESMSGLVRKSATSSLSAMNAFARGVPSSANQLRAYSATCSLVNSGSLATGNSAPSSGNSP